MKIIDLVGKRFTKLVVTKKLASRRGGSVLWECLCDCGNITQQSTRHLNRLNNTVKSCGCLKDSTVKDKKTQWRGYGELPQAWFSMHIKGKANCKKRPNIEVTIDVKFLWELFLEQNSKCALTGILLTININCALNTASVDRIDNTLGYIPGNIRWVHKDINMMQRVYSDEYFFKLCKQVVTYNNL